jgi:hypothetical protein
VEEFIEINIEDLEVEFEKNTRAQISFSLEEEELNIPSFLTYKISEISYDIHGGIWNPITIEMSNVRPLESRIQLHNLMQSRRSFNMTFEIMNYKNSTRSRWNVIGCFIRSINYKNWETMEIEIQPTDLFAIY